MKKDKVEYLKDKKVKAFADTNFQNAISKSAQNPIEAKFLAFRKTKKDVNLKDLL